MAHSGAHLDLSAFATAEELAGLGLDRLKSGLIALGLKCGGTLQVPPPSFSSSSSPSSSSSSSSAAGARRAAVRDEG